MPQIYKLAETFLKLDFKKALSDSLRSINRILNNSIIAKNNLILNYENQLLLKQDIIFGQDEVILGFKNLDKKSQKNIKWIKIQRNGLAILSIVLLSKVFLFQ